MKRIVKLKETRSIKRKGIHSKTKMSNSRSSKNYRKPYNRQGR